MKVAHSAFPFSARRIVTEPEIGRSVPAMTPRCPVCNEPMKEDGRAFVCKPCRQILIFFPVAEGSALWPSAIIEPSQEPLQDPRPQKK
jgi:hypothetical protein